MSRGAQQSGSAWSHHGLELMGWSLALAPCCAGLMVIDAVPDGVALLTCNLQGQGPVAHEIVCSSFKCPCSLGNNHVACHKGFLFPAADSLHHTMKCCVLKLPCVSCFCLLNFRELGLVEKEEACWSSCLGWSREAEWLWAGAWADACWGCPMGEARLSLARVSVGVGLAPTQMGMCSLCPTSSSQLPALGTPCLCFSLKVPSPSECWDRFSATKTPQSHLAERFAKLFPDSHSSGAEHKCELLQCLRAWLLGYAVAMGRGAELLGGFALPRCMSAICSSKAPEMCEMLQKNRDGHGCF